MTTPIAIHSPAIRLDQLLKLAGVVGTGGHAKVLVQEGRVRVDGQVETQRGRQLRPGARVAIEDGPELEVVQEEPPR